MVDIAKSYKDTDVFFHDSKDSEIDCIFESLSEYEDYSLDSDIKKYGVDATKKVREKKVSLIKK